MDNSGGIQASLAGRYATALFTLAKEKKKIDAVGKSLDILSAALSESDDFNALTTSPVLSRAEAGKAVEAAAKAMKLDPITKKFMGVLAGNRRLDQLKPAIEAYTSLAANHRGEIFADVTSAHPLDAKQITALKAQLKKRVGSDVSVSTQVDPSILGGLIVQMGSQMIDTSIKTRLGTLAQAMKG